VVEFLAWMFRIDAKRFNASVNPGEKFHGGDSRRLRKSATRGGALATLVCGAALAFLALSSVAWSQQSAGTGPQSNGSAAVASGADSSSAALQSLPKIADLAWLEGRWRGEWGPRVAEQVWLAPKDGLVLGDFRLIENDKLLVIEVFTLLEKPGGINFYFRHFTPELVPWEKSDATLLKLTRAEPKIFEFENSANGKPKRVVFTKIDADTYTWRSEIISDTGDSQTVEITYHRQPLSAIAPNSGAGSHPKKK
jgi:hypothetical protein